MKQYKFGDIKKEKFQKVTIYRIGKNIADITIDGSLSVVCTYFKKQSILEDNSILIKEIDGMFNNEKCKIFSITDLASKKSYNTLLVSSYSGMVVNCMQKDSNCFVSDADKLSDAAVFVVKTPTTTIIDFSGNNLNDGWCDYNFSCENIMIMHQLSAVPSFNIINTENGKSLGEFSLAEFTPDRKHIKVTKSSYQSTIIDFDGNQKMDWVADIEDKAIVEGNNSLIYFYIVHDVHNILYNENFEKVIDLTENDLTLTISSRASAEHIVLLNVRKNIFNILDRNLKPIFNPWLDDIDYNYFEKRGTLFLCHSPKGYTIMNWLTSKPIEGIPEFISDISRIESISYDHSRFGIKIKPDVCKILTFCNDRQKPYKIEFDKLKIKDIFENEPVQFFAYIDTDEGMFAVVPLPYKLELVRCDAMIDTYFDDVYIIKDSDKYNIINTTKDKISMYFRTGVDNVYDVTNRFIILEKNGKFAYFDTTKFDVVAIDGIRWWDDIETAEESHPDIWNFTVKDKNGKWITLQK